MPNFIKSYFKIIENIDWNSMLPPSNDVYDKIINLKELDEEKNELDEQKNVSNIQIKFLRTVSEKILSNKKTSIKARRTSKRLSEQIKRSSKRLSRKVRKNIKITVKDIYTNSYDKHLDFEMNRIDIFNNVKHLD